MQTDVTYRIIIKSFAKERYMHNVHTMQIEIFADGVLRVGGWRVQKHLQQKKSNAKASAADSSNSDTLNLL